ncbi:MAG: hypothetical protein EOP51_27255, partial [Sphingobacteriales bacterium]
MMQELFTPFFCCNLISTACKLPILSVITGGWYFKYNITQQQVMAFSILASSVKGIVRLVYWSLYLMLIMESFSFLRTSSTVKSFPDASPQVRNFVLNCSSSTSFPMC